MKKWLAEVVELGIDLLCALTNHAGGCRVWYWLWKPYCWAADISHETRDYEGRHECPFCGKERKRPATPVDLKQPTAWTVGTATSSNASTLWYRAT